jgi:micrococcal nuclease
MRAVVGHKGVVRASRISCLLVAAPMLGCLGFGGPLVAETGEGGGQDTSTGTETGTEQRCGPTTAVVDRVIDGDTIVLETGERVRYILVDTPEITDGKNECWGSEASAFNQMTVASREITLEYDEECEDQYGRLLAYVSVDGLEVNRTLLEKGFACVLHIPPNGDARFAEYQALEDAAKQAGIGMWSACATVACD